MKVAVVGPGAMGCLFAARLARSGIETTLVDYKSERALRLRESGITVETPDETYKASPNIVSSVPEEVDLALILVKSYSTKNLTLHGNYPVLTLQNGLSNIETLCSKVGTSRVVAGVTTQAATMLGEGRVRHVADGVTTIGSWTSCSPQPALEALTMAGFHVESTEAPGQMIWEKVAISACINPLTALLNVPNGALLEIPEVRQLMRDLVVEAVKVAGIEGYRFGYSLIERAEEVCQRTSENISSMLQDIRAGRKSEIDAISGEILRRAQQAALPCPRTRVIYQLVSGLEQR